MLSKDGTVKIYSVILRIGAKGSKVDNASSGGVCIGITSDGHLKSVGHTLDGQTVKIPCPTDVTIPAYNDIIVMASRLHPLMPWSRIVSWDFAVNENEKPVLIECNMSSGGINVHQLNNGPLFGDDTTLILDEVYNHKQYESIN